MMNTPSSLTHPAEALILAKVAQAVQQSLQRLRLMVFDVDGVLTDGKLWYGENGEIFKGFHALDGHGLRLLNESGIKVAIVTGRESAIVSRRSAELGISIVHQGVRDKLALIQEIAQQQHITLSEIGYMGDDLIDLPTMQRVGFAASVPNAPSYVSQRAHWVSCLPGGQGAARECCDLILAARGRLGHYINGLSLKSPAAAQ